MLAVGSAPVPGEGLRGGALGLPDRLAEELSEALGRDVQLTAVGDRTMTLESAADALTHEVVADQDVVVLTLGSGEALRGLRPSLWRRRMTALLEQLDRTTTASTRILAVGVPAVQLLPGFPQDRLKSARRCSRRLNRLTRRLAREHERVTFVRLPAGRSGLDLGPAAEAYWRWAVFLAPQIAKRLPRAPAIPPASAERARTRFAERVEGLPDAASESLLRLVSHARLSFGTRYAALALADGDGSWRYWTMGWTDDQAAAPAHQVTLTLDGFDVVTDARRNPRFDALSAVIGEPVAFFAGARVEWSGVPVGALFVFDGRHRSGGVLDEQLLRDLTSRVEHEVRSMLADRHPLADAIRPLGNEPPVQTGQLAFSA